MIHEFERRKIFAELAQILVIHPKIPKISTTSDKIDIAAKASAF
jgi:hypothetical protein